MRPAGRIVSSCISVCLWKGFVGVHEEGMRSFHICEAVSATGCAQKQGVVSNGSREYPREEESLRKRWGRIERKKWRSCGVLICSVEPVDFRADFTWRGLKLFLVWTLMRQPYGRSMRTDLDGGL